MIRNCRSGLGGTGARLAAGLLVLAVIACNLTAAPAAGPATAVPPTVSATPGSPPPATPTATHTLDLAQFKPALDAGVAAFMQTDNATACSVAVVYPPPGAGKLQTQLYNYGTLTKASPTPADSNTFYEIGSLTKLFTSDLLALYVQQGSLQLNDPLQEYLPANVHVPTFGGQVITLVQLVTHTSGLPRTDGHPLVRQINGVTVWGYGTDDEVFNFLDHYQLTRAPGSQWEYSNLSNALMGIVEEQVGHSSYEQLVVSQIAVPLGLPNTRMTLSAADQTHLAQGYHTNGQPAPSVADTGATLAAGALRSTIQDQATYLVDNIDASGLSLAAVLDMTHQRQSKGPSPKVVMGLGWLISNPGTPQEQFTKDGSTAGYSSYIAFSKVTRTGFALLCNSGGVSKDLAPKVNQSLLGSSETVTDDNQ